MLRNLRVYQELLAVLASALVALAIWQHQKAHASPTDAVTADEILAATAVDDAAPMPPLDLAPSATSSPSEPGARPLSASKEKMLVLGDSMVEVLSPYLNAYAIENRHEMVPAIWYGSTTAAWAKSPELGKLLREINPTMVIVVLGSSELTSPSIESRKPFVDALLKRIGPRKVVWVGPPNWRADTGINDLLETELGKDRFFRSEHLELPRKHDGIHPNAEGGRIWMNAVASWLSTESRFETQMNPPSHTAAAPPARVLGSM